MLRKGKIGMSDTKTNSNKITFEEELDRHGFLVFPCSGTSMLPLLHPEKDLVEIQKKTDQRCKKYDVVLYKRGTKYILHRILKVRGKDYVLAGDHQVIKETGVTDAQIIGVLTGIVRDGKKITLSGWKYRFYMHVWCDLFPLRYLFLKLMGLIGRG